MTATRRPTRPLSRPYVSPPARFAAWLEHPDHREEAVCLLLVLLVLGVVLLVFLFIA